MIILAVSAPIKPEHRDEMIQAAIAVQDATRQEPGCITYTFHTEVADPNKFFVYEVWESNEAWDSHMKQEHTRTFLEKVGKTAAGSINAERYDVPAGSKQSPAIE
jgi:quinol monooxygenase YgiN